MIKKFILATVAALLISEAPVFSQYEEPISLGENCTLLQTVIDDQEKIVVCFDDVPSYEVVTRTFPDTVKLFFFLKDFNENTLKIFGIKWFKANLISSPSDEHSKFFIHTYYDSDSAFQFAPDLSYFRSRNKELVKSVIGVDLIGMSQEDMLDLFGEGTRTPAGRGYRYMHSIKDILHNSSDERFYFYTEDAKITEIAYEKHNTEEQSVAMKSFWGYRPVPEGWLTKGECTAANIKVMDSIPDGNVIGTIGGAGKENEVMVLEIATTGDKFNWVKIVTKSGLTGWVYGKYIRPGIFGTSFEQTLNNSIEYCEWLASALKSPKSVEENYDQNGIAASITKVYNGYNVEYILPGGGNEEQFFSIEFTNQGIGHNNRFCGIGIGDDVDAANEFANNMLKADAVPYERGQEFYQNSMLKWITVDQKAEIIVGTSDGFVSCIIVRKILN